MRKNAGANVSDTDRDSDFDDTVMDDIDGEARRPKSPPQTVPAKKPRKPRANKPRASTQGTAATAPTVEQIAAATHKAGMLAVIMREGLLIAIAAGCGFLTLALATFDPFDPGWSNTGTNTGVANAGGPAGAWVADVAFSLFGYMAYLFPLMLGYQAWCVLRDRQGNLFDPVILGLRVIGFCLVMVSATGMAVHSQGMEASSLPSSVGGVLGLSIANAVDGAFGVIGGSLMLLSLLLFGLTIFIDISWLKVMDAIGRAVLALINHIAACWQRYRKHRQAQKAAREAHRNHQAEVEPYLSPAQAPLTQMRKTPTISLPQNEPPQLNAAAVAPTLTNIKTNVATALAPLKGQGSKALSSQAEQEKQGTLFEQEPVLKQEPVLAQEPIEGELPPIHLLEAVQQADKKGFSEESLEAMSRLLELKLKDFGITVEVVEVLPGPVVTRFELQLAPGIKASRITGLAQDVARSLAVISVRVVEVIQGKSVIGIEIPNEEREMVRLSEVIASKIYDKSRSPLTFALGHDISGQPVIADLAKMPHLLVAGTTGSGKSVGVNSMLVSILYKASPEEVRLLLVDPKMLELSVYEGIPHLLAPVITDMKDAATGLRWCVGEMERRYKLMAALGVRNLAGYNKKVSDAIDAGEPIIDPLWLPDEAGIGVQQAPPLECLPFIVVVIDEFADMMMIVGKKVEQLIARIAQKARAAGIHMVLATQRPSVDVITGLIKANVPTRIAFQVSSKIDSRTILDQGGAEQLLGHGDMLYLPPGTSLPVRVHGAFVDDHEVHAVVADWKKRGKPNYLDDIFSEATDAVVVPGFTEESSGGDDESDPLYDEAVAFVTETRKASISSVQRKMRIGYNRAARLIEQMEASGVITAMGHNGSRDVLAPPPPR